MEHKVITRQAAEEISAGIPTGVKESRLLSGSWDGPYAIAVVVADNIKPKAEIHKSTADVWCVLSGKGKMILGGKLVEPEFISEIELTSDSIEGGEEIQVAEGDVIDIPPGVAHQFDARGGRLELLILKIRMS